MFSMPQFEMSSLRRETMELCEKCHGKGSSFLAHNEKQKQKDLREFGKGLKECPSCNGRGYK